jgi:hypothetical protein
MADRIKTDLDPAKVQEVLDTWVREAWDALSRGNYIAFGYKAGAYSRMAHDLGITRDDPFLGVVAVAKRKLAPEQQAPRSDPAGDPFARGLAARLIDWIEAKGYLGVADAIGRLIGLGEKTIPSYTDAEAERLKRAILGWRSGDLRVEGFPSPSKEGDHAATPAAPADADPVPDRPAGDPRGAAADRDGEAAEGARPAAAPAPAPAPIPVGSEPKSGKALYAWLKAREDTDGVEGIVRYVNKWGQARGLKRPITEWKGSDLADAYAEAREFLARAGKATAASPVVDSPDDLKAVREAIIQEVVRGFAARGRKKKVDGKAVGEVLVELGRAVKLAGGRPLSNVGLCEDLALLTLYRQAARRWADEGALAQDPLIRGLQRDFQPKLVGTERENDDAQV